MGMPLRVAHVHACVYYKFIIFIVTIEIPHNFSHYLNRFTMPSNDHPFWYSWDMGPVHFIR